MTDTEKQALTEYIESLHLTYTATFQPTHQPKEVVKHPQLHWLITIQKDTRTMSIPFSQGTAHVLGYQQTWDRKTLHDQEREDRYRKTCESGWAFKSKQPPPTLIDVLYCLISDADVLNYSSYEDWGPDLGYDIDSRKGEAVYRECIAQALALKDVVGFAAIEKLRELYQDY